MSYWQEDSGYTHQPYHGGLSVLFACKSHMKPHGDNPVALLVGLPVPCYNCGYEDVKKFCENPARRPQG